MESIHLNVLFLLTNYASSLSILTFIWFHETVLNELILWIMMKTPIQQTQFIVKEGLESHWILS